MMWLIWILPVMTTNKPEWFWNVGALTKTNFNPHVYFGGNNLRYDSDKLCYVSEGSSDNCGCGALIQSQNTSHLFIITVNQ